MLNHIANLFLDLLYVCVGALGAADSLFASNLILYMISVFLLACGLYGLLADSPKSSKYRITK